MADRKEDEYGVSAVALESLERNFVEVMKELSAEDNLERFKLEYEKLHRSLKKSHENQKRLIKKCQELNQEIMLNAAKVQSALQMSKDDETTMASLKKQIEMAWKRVDGAHEKEARAKDTIQMLKKEVARLTTLVEQGAGMTLGHESNLQDLIEEKKRYAKDCDVSKQKNIQLQHELKEWVEKVRKMNLDFTDSEAELGTLTQEYQHLYKDFDKEQRQKEVGEAKANELHKSIENQTKDAEKARENLRILSAEHQELEKRWKDEKDKVHELNVKSEKAHRDLQYQGELNGQYEKQNKQLADEDKKKQQDLAKKEVEVNGYRTTNKKLQKAIEQQRDELTKLQKERDTEGSKTSGYTDKINDRLAIIEDHKRRIEEKERMIKGKVREKNLEITKGAREESERVKLEGSRVIEQGKNRSLAQELDSHLRSNEALRKDIFILERQQESYYQQSQDASNKFAQALQQVRMGKDRVASLQVELEDAQKKLKNQHSMYEQVRSDRALYKKSLNEAQEEINEMMRKFKLMDHNIDQLKEELSSKERLLCQAHATHKQLGKDIANAEQRVNHLKEDYSHSKGRGDALADEIKQLTQIIADCDTEKAKQHMKFNSVTNERNILATQLIRRNDELALLYEKIRIQQSTLGKGEAQYRERLVDIKMLRDKVQELRVSLRVSLARIRNVEEMKRHIATLQRQLMHERTKVKALYEELQNPMNVHRWRQLEGSDPQDVENILKLQTLQRRLIAKSEECVAKDRLIQDKEGQYSQLKNILSRQPGPEVAEQLGVYHENIVKRAAQMKRMENELDSTHTQVTEYKQDVERLSSELLDVKKKFFTLKSKNTLLVRERQLAAAGTAASGVSGGLLEDMDGFIIHHPQKQPRFAGGGFSLSQ